MSQAEDPALSSSSPLTSPVDESDNPLSHPLDAEAEEPLPGLDGTPVRCESSLSATVHLSYPQA
ncbi:hypothetical protein TRAPUB_13585 [Trametes pubescens]|uniref:Uncharacterized protein n=1 Tax=Trametes pubescens TaxID=154538 RepID=A0A1M2VQV8_TRAPU|nr:hypothetical protein TRAPUB_13585 [Trametes pubescens]